MRVLRLRPNSRKARVYHRLMKLARLGLVLLVAAAVLPMTNAEAGARPPLSMSKARLLVQQFSQRVVVAGGGGYAAVGACARLASWKVECAAALNYDDETRCSVVFVVWNTPVVNGYYGRRFSHRGMSCTTPPSTPPAVPPPPVAPPPPVTTPTELPLSVARPVADAYVGGIMQNAHSTFGGVDYCSYPIGYSVNCSYSFSGNRIADGSYYRCTGTLTINGTYSTVFGWRTTVDYGLGPQCY